VRFLVLPLVFQRGVWIRVHFGCPWCVTTSGRTPGFPAAATRVLVRLVVHTWLGYTTLLGSPALVLRCAFCAVWLPVRLRQRASGSSDACRSTFRCGTRFGFMPLLVQQRQFPSSTFAACCCHLNTAVLLLVLHALVLLVAPLRFPARCANTAPFNAVCWFVPVWLAVLPVCCGLV